MLVQIETSDFLLKTPSGPDLIAGGIIAACFLTLIAIAECWHRVGRPPVEWTRKLVHLGGGLVCLTMPFVIESHWVVLVLAISMGLIFVISKRFGWLQSIHGVNRKSSGTEFYPVVISLLFLLTAGLPWKFVICVLVLAVADAMAALVGKKFGRLMFSIENDSKSVAGSLAFLVVTILVVLVPLLIWDPMNGDADRMTRYTLTALLIGLLVMCIELVSLKGTDNLWIPLGTFLVLSKTLQTDVADLVIQNVSFASILVIVIVAASISKVFNVGGSVVFCLASYGCWAMGSFDWALPIFIGFVAYLLISFLLDTPWKLRVRPVLYSVVPPFLILATANIFLNLGDAASYGFLFVPFLTSVSVALTQACANQLNWRCRKDMRRRLLNTLITGVVISVILNLPAVLLGTIDWPAVLVIGSVTVLACVISAPHIPPLPPGDAPLRWLYLRAFVSLIAGIVAAIGLYFGLVAGGLPS